jgi:tetratricopeptide (TPR) repeat protein
MKAIVESHGGTVEKFIGDAVMAVFGVPQVHEDDALRACRTAVEMRDALPELGVQARIGVNTGEVVTGTEERLATGDAVNVAARLEQAAQPGEILIGEKTLALVRDVIEAEPVEQLELKGKEEPVIAHRLEAVTGELTRRHEAPMIGRTRQRRLLEGAFAGVVADRACHLFTILGVAGVGKSRLTHEFLHSVDAQVVRGRCRSYGEGITYWPAAEVVTQLGVRPGEGSAAAAIRSMMGETSEPTTPDEIAWAVRKTLEQAASASPVLCVFDDLHWAEPSLLDLVEHVADWSRDAPILLLCIARPELLDKRPGWAGGKMNATTVLLEPLTPEETDELIERLAPLDRELRARIGEAAEGNPLFVEEMLAMVREAGNGDVKVPPTIQALLAARLDQLEAPERAVLERGAVEGKVFHRGAVEALTPEEAQVPQRLMGLVRKELVRPDTPMLTGDDAFRFRHLLIRDAAYDALPKAIRVELHARFALWLEGRGLELVELDEIVGYHLEQASQYRRELGLQAELELDASATQHLTAAGRRAMVRSDQSAAVSLLRRALALVPADTFDLALELDIVDALFGAGRMAESKELAESLSERGAAAGNRTVELCGRLWIGFTRLFLEPEGASDELAELVDGAVPLFEAEQDDVALYVAHFARGMVGHMRARMDDELRAMEQAVIHARRAGLGHLEIGLLPPLGSSRLFGSTPVSEVVAWLDEQEERGLRFVSLRGNRSMALAMLGHIEEARGIAQELRQELSERGGGVHYALLISHQIPTIELLAGDPRVAAESGEEGCRLLEEMGDRAWLSTAVGMLGEAYLRLGRLDEAERSAERARELGASDDAITQILWRDVTANVLALRGEHAEAERLAREAVEIAEATDMLVATGETYLYLADVLRLAGRPKEAVEALEVALALFERKGVLPRIERTRASLLQLEQ